jgi:hypothetical protein
MSEPTPAGAPWWRRHSESWALFALASAAALVAPFVLVAVALVPSHFTAESVVAVRPIDPEVTSPDDLKLLAGEVAVYLSNDRVHEDAAFRGAGSRSTAPAESGVEVGVDAETATVRISATSTDPVESVRVVDQLVVMAESTATDRARLDVLAHGADNEIAVGPSRLLLLAASGIVGAGLVVGAVVLVRAVRHAS